MADKHADWIQQWQHHLRCARANIDDFEKRLLQGIRSEEEHYPARVALAKAITHAALLGGLPWSEGDGGTLTFQIARQLLTTANEALNDHERQRQARN